MRDRLDRTDFRFLAITLALLLLAGWFGIRYFADAFPEASIEFKVGRGESMTIAQKLLHDLGLARSGKVPWKTASQFESDDLSKIFLERELGLRRANQLMKGPVSVWYWTDRWFRPLQKEEMIVRVSPGGRVVGFQHARPEDAALPSVTEAAARAMGERFLDRVGVAREGIDLVSISRRDLPHRTQWILTWHSRSLHPASAPYRYRVTVDGNTIGAYGEGLKVPDAWERDYRNLRSKNNAAGMIDTIFLALTFIAALVVFIVRLRRGDVAIRFVIAVGITCAVLVTAVGLNSFPSALAGYDTTSSYPAFVAGHVFSSALQGVFMAFLLMVIVGAGEPLYRERFPLKLAIPRLFRPKALRSKRVFKGFVLGYALVAIFLAYQVAFYMIADRLGAWSPADIPYDEILNTAFPWVAVLFIGFFPALSEEFISRAFSIPFFEKVFRSRLFAIVLAGFIWGFGHATYPNQPFYIRGLEVGIAGVFMGLILFRFGLLPLLVWHYTVDALYTALVLFRSGNLYYILSAAAAALIFLFPLLVSIVLYFVKGGFEPDEELDNRAIGTAPAPPPPPEPETPPLPAPRRPQRLHLAIIAIAIAAIAGIVLLSGPTLDSVADYRIDPARAEQIARRHLAEIGVRVVPQKVLVVPVPGFRSWDEDSSREDGGSPDGYFQVAAEYITRESKRGLDALIGIEIQDVQGATWVVRFFTPQEKNEIFVEIDPRTSKVVGYHRYQSETNPGPSLARAQAERTASSVLQRYGVDPAQVEVKEALQYPQPKRKDWLFHFQSRQPLAAQAWERATVRVAGREVTQFAKTVKIPEAEVRKAEETRLVNIALIALKIAAALLLLTLVVSGFVYGFRSGRFVWRRATRITAMLIVVPVVAIFLDLPAFVQSYDTSMAWNTFLVMIVAGGVGTVAAQLGMLFLSIAIIETGYPASRRLIDVRQRRPLVARAVAAVAAAISIFALASAVASFLPRWFGHLGFAPDPISPSPLLVATAPAFGALWSALLITVGGSAVVVCLVTLFRSVPQKYHSAVRIILFGSVAILMMPSSLHGEVWAILVALAGAAILLLVGFVILGGDPLAWPLAIFSWSILASAFGLFANHNSALRWNAAALLAVLAIVVLWLFRRGKENAIAGEGEKVELQDQVPRES
ncbi:MAG: type II CAAX endopeptidase family protein [Thermoanaerobaculia bacterium]